MNLFCLRDDASGGISYQVDTIPALVIGIAAFIAMAFVMFLVGWLVTTRTALGRHRAITRGARFTNVMDFQHWLISKIVHGLWSVRDKFVGMKEYGKVIVTSVKRWYEEKVEAMKARYEAWKTAGESSGKQKRGEVLAAKERRQQDWMAEQSG